MAGQANIAAAFARLTAAINAAANLAGSGGGGAAGIHAASPMPVGGFATNQVNALALSTIAAAVNQLNLMPFIPARAITIDQIGTEVTIAGAAATTCRLGLYDSNANGEPNALLVQGAAVINTDAIGAKTTVVAAQALVAGQLYWLALLTSGAPTLRAVALGGLYALPGNATLTGNYTLRRATFAYAALPAAAPVTVPTASIAPLFRLRKSA